MGVEGINIRMAHPCCFPSIHLPAHPGIVLFQEEKLRHSRKGLQPGEGTRLSCGSTQPWS